MSLSEFVAESNRIEGITRAPYSDEIKAHEHLLSQPELEVGHMVEFVSVIQPDARLRDRPDVPGVRVGNHIAPPSGPGIREGLELILGNLEYEHPFQAHVSYETLHPFTDGNGRSGRAIWLWQMVNHRGFRVGSLSFLHAFYYQSLQEARDGE